MYTVRVSDVDQYSPDYGRDIFWAEFSTELEAEDYCNQLRKFELELGQVAYVLEDEVD